MRRLQGSPGPNDELDKNVPPENMIYAVFDCWGEGEKATIFKRDLVKNIMSRHYYKGKDLKFILDSLFCEDQKGMANSKVGVRGMGRTYPLYCQNGKNGDLDKILSVFRDRNFILLA